METAHQIVARLAERAGVHFVAAVARVHPVIARHWAAGLGEIEAGAETRLRAVYSAD